MQIFSIVLSILIALSSLLFFKKANYRLAIFLLFIAALILRLVMTTLDPFLNNWDEHFHAIVAKNMMKYPFQPMLHVETIQAYNFKEWCCNHVWLHKQPLFLWQMALSMKLFGVSEITLRLPSAIMGAILVLATFRIASILVNKETAYYAAFLMCFPFYQLELISGAIGMDHNDIAFLFYTTMSVWAFIEYTTAQNRKWLMLIGIFAGSAILCKWLTGLWVFSVWGIWIISQKDKRKNIQNYMDYLISILICCITFLPWQIYTAIQFPLESHYESEYNSKHLWEVVEEHGGNWYYYLVQTDNYFGKGFSFIICISLLLFVIAKIPKQNKISLLVAIGIPYFFFSVIAQTKMPSYIFFVSPLIYILIGYFVDYLCKLIIHFKYIFCIKIALVLFLTYLTFRLEDIIDYHLYNETSPSLSFTARKQKIHNTLIYKELNKLVPKDYVIFNIPPYEDTEAMFFSNRTAYEWLTEEEYMEYKKKGVKIAIIKQRHHERFNIIEVPEYLLCDPNVLIVNRMLE